MHKLKLENITRNDDGSYALHVLVYDPAAADVILTRLSTPLASHSEADQRAAVDKIKGKFDAWKGKETGKDAIKAALQAKLDGI